MRSKDENKRTAIYNAAVRIINESGFANASVSKIAKLADVSSSTIYVYFENKKDMLNKIFLFIKEESGNFIFNEINPDSHAKEGIKIIWNKTYEYAVKNPDKFSFSEQYANSPIINNISKEQGKKYYMPLFDYLSRSIKKGEIKKIKMEILIALILSPVIHLAKQKISGNIDIPDEAIQKTFLLIWDSIKN